MYHIVLAAKALITGSLRICTLWFTCLMLRFPRRGP